MAGRGREALPEDWGVGMPYRRAERGRDALLEGREGLGIPTKGPGGVGRPSRRTGGLGGPPGRPGAVGSPPSGPGGVERLSQRVERVQEALPEGQEGSGCSTGGSERVGRPSQRVGRGCEALLKSQVGSVCPTGGPGGIERGWESLQDCWGDGRPSGRVGRGREDLSEGQAGREAHLEGWERSKDPPGGLVGVGRSYLRAERIREIHPK